MDGAEGRARGRSVGGRLRLEDGPHLATTAEKPSRKLQVAPAYKNRKSKRFGLNMAKCIDRKQKEEDERRMPEGKGSHQIDLRGKGGARI